MNDHKHGSGDNREQDILAVSNWAPGDISKTKAIIIFLADTRSEAFADEFG